MSETTDRPTTTVTPHRRTTREAKREADRAKREISDTLDELKYRVQEKRDEIVAKVHVLDRLRDVVRDNPLALVGGAVVAGLVFGWLTGGKDAPGYGALGDDEVDEIRRWREERRRYLHHLEKLVADSVRGPRPPSVMERVRARLGRDRHDDDEDD